MSKLTAGELPALYESLKRLKASSDWAGKGPDMETPIDFNAGELIALDELLRGFRLHFRRQKGKSGATTSKGMKNICLVLGDYNGDGHEETQNVWVECSKSLKHLERAYALGTKKLGFDFCTTVCTGGHTLPKRTFSLLVSLGWVPPKHITETKRGLDFDDFVQVFLFLVSLGDPEIVVRVITPEGPPTMWIGGYGLFLEG